jgi:hypothetical protein
MAKKAAAAQNQLAKLSAPGTKKPSSLPTTWVTTTTKTARVHKPAKAPED